MTREEFIIEHGEIISENFTGSILYGTLRNGRTFQLKNGFDEPLDIRTPSKISQKYLGLFISRTDFIQKFGSIKSERQYVDKTAYVLASGEEIEIITPFTGENRRECRINITLVSQVSDTMLTFSNVWERRVGVLADISNGIDLNIYTENDLLGVKNEVTMSLLTAEDAEKEFLNYVFGFVYAYLDINGKQLFRLTKALRVRLLTPSFFKYHDLEDYMQGSKNVIGNPRDFLNDLMKMMMESKISDVSMAVGCHIMLRDGEFLRPYAKYPIITESSMHLLQDEILCGTSDTKKEAFYTDGATRIPVFLEGVGILRISLAMQMGTATLSIRFIPEAIRPLEDFRLPKYVINQCLSGDPGIILVVGTTNNGKSALAVSIIREVLNQGGRKVVVAQNPRENTFKHAEGLITQHDLGDDLLNDDVWKEMLLTFDANYGYYAEIKTTSNLKSVIQASQGGKPIISTFHERTVEGTFKKISNYLADDRESLVAFADMVKVIIVQKLVARKGGGRVTAHEIFNVTNKFRSALLEESLPSIMTDLKDQTLGNTLMENDLWNLANSRVITEETRKKESDPEIFAGMGVPTPYKAEYDTDVLYADSKN